jgi:hypothetical protein
VHQPGVAWIDHVAIGALPVPHLLARTSRAAGTSTGALAVVIILLADESRKLYHERRADQASRLT